MRRFEEKVKKLRSERPNIQMDDSQITLKNRNLTHKPPFACPGVATLFDGRGPPGGGGAYGSI